MINIQKGLKDVLPAESYKWQFLERKLRTLAGNFCFDEIRTPTFEATELFLRGVGDTTDIVNKEMYTFLDKGGRSVTLKPEGTAAVARSYIENSIGAAGLPVKTYYITPVFRYEKPQKGRLREHHQFGAELYGADGPLADIEILSLAGMIFDALKIKNVKLHLNSIGCPDCRKVYNTELKKYYSAFEKDICPDCQERLQKNPMRLLDCKVEKCRGISKNAPRIADYLCKPCEEHLGAVTGGLTSINLPFIIDKSIVRGLDYYTRTVFEFVLDGVEGGQSGTILAGGRYDGLVERIGGAHTPAIGFGCGLERLLLVMEEQKLFDTFTTSKPVFVAAIETSNTAAALFLATGLREKGVKTEADLMGRSLKAQMKYASRINASHVIFVGGEEHQKGGVTIKDMQKSTSEFVAYGSVFNEVSAYPFD